jgi:hypothetical protein
VLQWCYSGVTLVLNWCYSGVIVVLQWCHSGVKVIALFTGHARLLLHLVVFESNKFGVRE